MADILPSDHLASKCRRWRDSLRGWAWRTSTADRQQSRPTQNCPCSRWEPFDHRVTTQSPSPEHHHSTSDQSEHTLIRETRRVHSFTHSRFSFTRPSLLDSIHSFGSNWNWFVTDRTSNLSQQRRTAASTPSGISCRIKKDWGQWVTALYRVSAVSFCQPLTRLAGHLDCRNPASSTKPSIDIAPTIIATALTHRELLPGSYLFEVSNSGLLCGHITQPATLQHTWFSRFHFHF